MTVAEDRPHAYPKTEEFDVRGPGPRAAIARALISSGISLWHGIPDKIMEELYAADYKVKKKKKKKKPKELES